MKQIAVIGLSGQSIMLEVKDFARPGETVIINNIHYELGGKGFNQAVALATLGCKVAFCSSVGTDEYGNNCYNKLVEKKVNPFLFYKENTSTALATVFTNSLGENEVSVYHGAASLLSEDDITAFASEIKNSSYVLVQLEQDLKITKKIVEIANIYKVPVIINPAPAVNYDLELLQQAYIITPNENEAEIIFGYNKTITNQDLLNKTQKLGLKRIVITLGKEGSILIWEGVIHYIPTYTVNSIDTVGAGDAFNAGLVYSLNKGNNIFDAIKFATITGALSTTKLHVLDSFPTEKEVNNFASKNS